MPANNEINLFVASVTPDSVESATTVEIIVALKNSGMGTSNVNGLVINSDSQITVIEESAQYGEIGTGETADNSATPFVLSFDESIPEGSLLDITLRITAGDGSYEKVVRLYFLVGEPLVEATFTHASDSTEFTISNFGTYGLAPTTIAGDDGVGFLYPAGADNHLYQCGLLIGVDTTRVSDGISNLIGSVDTDFQVALGGNLEEISPGLLGDVETVSSFHDGGAPRPLGITIEQRTASCQSGSCANYVILEYVITNDGPEHHDSVYAGLYLDWDFPFDYPAGSSDAVGFSRENNLGYMYDRLNPQYRGTAVISRGGVSSFLAVPNAVFIYDHVTEEEKYFFLTAGTTDTASAPGFTDHSYCISTGPFDLPPGASDTAAFAVLAGSSLEQLELLAIEAIDFYRTATPIGEVETATLPAEFRLEQNYPNPFNPETTIRYTVPGTRRVTITVYNILGRRVITLLDQEQSAGTHQVTWNGVDERGAPVASGLYLYRMVTDGFSEVKKMLLLK
jgi:hypothetical protein